jgi:hypothetical protein
MWPRPFRLYGTGTDAATPAIDYSNETTGLPSDIDIDGTLFYAANPNTIGKTIADQLVAAGRTWKSYQEDLPPTGADGVNNADGFFPISPPRISVLLGKARRRPTLSISMRSSTTPLRIFKTFRKAQTRISA